MKLVALVGLGSLTLACAKASDDPKLEAPALGAPGGSSGAAGRSGGQGGASGNAGAGKASAGGSSAGGAASGSAGTAASVSGAAGASRAGAAGRAGGNAGGNAGGGVPGDSGASGAGGSAETESDYDAVVLSDGPVAYLLMDHASGTEPDVTGNGRDGAHQGGAVTLVNLPNGDQASELDGEGQFVAIPSHASLSVPTTHDLTWEAWIRPDELEFPNDSNGYVNWMGKCQSSKSNCEWQARMYKTTNDEGRCNRISAYIFNETGGLGSAADWQPECGLIQAGSWYHVVGEYTIESEPSNCQDRDAYPGSIEIWVNGVKWDHASHGQTGCMSQYDVIPTANDSPVNIGTNAKDAWFAGAIGKVAFYDELLPESAIVRHYQAMTGRAPTGSCAGECSF